MNSSNIVVLRYFSARSGKTTTMLPRSMRAAVRTAASRAAPLDMPASSFLKDRAAISNRLAKVYYYDGATADYVEYSEEFVNVHGTGGAYSTPTELAQFLKMILADGLGPTGRVLAAESVAAMLAQPYAGLPLDVDSGARSGPFSEPAQGK